MHDMRLVRRNASLSDDAIACPKHKIVSAQSAAFHKEHDSVTV
jgi:hypothetical protein